MNKPGLTLIDRQVMWSRLIAVVEEQAETLQRTAFSTVVRESGDLAAGVFDADARMLAQAVTGTPGHINSMALAVGHVIDHYPIPTMQPGDVFIHNDPSVPEAGVCVAYSSSKHLAPNVRVLSDFLVQN